MNKKEVIVRIIILISIICFVFIIFPFICNSLIQMPSSFGFITSETKSAWIGYIGSSMGGLLTLLGVYITLNSNEQIRQKTFDDNLKLTNEQMRLDRLPVLAFTVMQKEKFDNADLDHCGSFYLDTEYTEDIKKIYVYISIKNKGPNLAKNVRLQIIVENIKDCGQTTLQNVVSINETKDICCTFCCSKNYVLENDGDVSIKLIFFYDDILNNCYSHEYNGYIYLNNVENENTSLGISLTSSEEPKLSKIKYFYISDEDISKKEKEKEALEEANEILKRENAFHRKKELDNIVKIFRETYLNSKMKKLTKYIIKEELNGGGTEGLIDFNIISDNLVHINVGGAISSEERKLEYSYLLKVDLNKKVVLFADFKILKHENLSLTDIIKIRLLFMSKKVKCITKFQ